jgi:hypothetical protein
METYLKLWKLRTGCRGHILEEELQWYRDARDFQHHGQYGGFRVSSSDTAVATPRGRLDSQWLHVLLPVLLAAWRALGDAPARSLTALAQRLGVSETDAAPVVTPLEELAPLATAPAVGPAAPLVPMTAPNGASSTPKTLLHRRHVIAVRKKTTR